MAVWTKGYVVSQNRSVFFIASLVERALNGLIGSLRDRMLANRGRAPDDLYSRGVEVRVNPDTEGLDFAFTHEGDRRILTMYFNLTDKGPHGLNDSSLCLMMGCSGKSEHYMTTALKALAALGPTYFVACDADDAPVVALTTQPMSYLEACQRRLALPTRLSLAQWVKEFESGTLAAQTEVEALGIERREAERVLSMDHHHDSNAVLIEEMAKAARVPMSWTAALTGARTLCFEGEEPCDIISCDMDLLAALDVFNRGSGSYSLFHNLDGDAVVCERNGERVQIKAGWLTGARADGTGAIHLQSRQVLRVTAPD